MRSKVSAVSPILETPDLFIQTWNYENISLGEQQVSHGLIQGRHLCHISKRVASAFLYTRRCKTIFCADFRLLNR